MKNYVIGTLAVVILVLASIIYKNETSPRKRFPVLEETETRGGDVEVPLFLYVFFTKRNCQDCLEVMDILNNLPPHFIVTGVVPKHDLKDENELRHITGAAFPLISAAKHRKYIPWYAPTIIGVSPARDIIFALPGVPGEKTYLETFLDSLYNKVYPVFLEEKVSQ